MTLETPLLILAGAAGWSILSKLLDGQTRFKRRVIDEVAVLLRKPDEDQLRELLDPLQNRGTFFSARDYTYRREQRSRLDRLQEQYYRLDHNSRVVYQWADTEWYDMMHHHLEESYGPELCAKIKDLRLAAVEFRVAMRVMLARIWLLGLLHFDGIPFMPVPTVAALATTGSIDLLRAYQRVKEAAVALATVYGDGNEFSQEIAALM